MSYIESNPKLCDFCGKCQEVCPFDAITVTDSKVEISAQCRLCLQCVKKCPKEALKLVEEKPHDNHEQIVAERHIPLERFRHIMVFAEYHEGRFEPVTYELLGKARELADKLGQKVLAVVLGDDVVGAAQELLYYGVDKVLVYRNQKLKFFDAPFYARILEKAVEKELPGILLMGATMLGRSLAPRLACRLRTGLTADCTVLDVRPNGDLVQTRPAFGGNIMATILTKMNRPQMATVRYGVFEAAPRKDKPMGGEIEVCEAPDPDGDWGLDVLDEIALPKAQSISEADVIVALGRGVRSQKDIGMFGELAQALGGVLAASRPLVEKGWFSAKSQVGLSGRTVKPKLYVALGISGAVQHLAGMSSSGTIIAINQDKNAPVFNVAHYGIVGDIYQVVPELLKLIKAGQGGREDEQR